MNNSESKSKSKLKHERVYDPIIEQFAKDPICNFPRTSTAPRQDTFLSLRPPPYTVADYSISQTDTKLDAGETKIHIQQTEASYDPLTEPIVPPKRKPKRNKYYSGGPAKWKFVDEIWREKQVELQKVYHAKFAVRVAKRKKSEKRKAGAEHLLAQSMVGPSWFQELSPKQIAAVDDLRRCILKDNQSGTVCCTKDAIATLGLVLRPNGSHLRVALRQCCDCPVEFLLILYQVLNPQRTKYSINDRLLLSAVVHLTMTRTLRELHIRIPSPPRRPRCIPKPKKNARKLRYDSPYLEPYIFKKEPRKFEGDFYNKHRQYPESPYFSYLPELRRDIQENSANPVTLGDGVDEDIFEETQWAQEVYQELADFIPIPKLLPPSRYWPCYNIFNQRPESISLIETVHDLETEEQVDLAVAEYVEEPGVNQDQEENADLVIEAEDEGIQVDQDPEEEVDEEVEEEEEKEEEEKIPYPDPEGAKVYKREDFILGPRPEVYDECYKPDIVDEEAEDVFPQYPITSRPCPKCRDEVFRFAEEKFCGCQQCELSRKYRNFEFEIGGVCTVNGELVPIISGLHPKRPCRCMEKYEARMRRYEEFAKKKCKCTYVNKVEIKKPLCECENCIENRELRNYGYMIGGVAESAGQLVPIVSGVFIKKPCQCLQRYDKKIQEMEEYSKRMEAVRDLKLKKDKYIIGGVVNRPEGPIYVIQGLRPEVKCCCAEKMRAELKEQQRIQNMPKVPPGRIKYGITGVKETPNGNIYILSHAIDTPPCDCMQIYDKYERQHYECIKMYEDFLSNVKEEINSYMEELKPSFGERRASLAASEVQYEPGNVSEEHLDEIQEENAEIVEETNFSEDEEEEEEENVSQHEPETPPDPCLDLIIPRAETKEDSSSPCGCQAEVCFYPDNEPEVEECAKEIPCGLTASCNCQLEKLMKEKNEELPVENACNPPPNPHECFKTATKSRRRSSTQTKKCCPGKSKPKKKLKCGCCSDKEEPKKEILECVECDCGPPPPEPEPPVEEVVKPTLKRFFIFDKIPCRRNFHLDVLQKALESMAEDGYPLAKLPECHKLPHFKLWMELRCGTYWTLPDRYMYNMRSKMLWRHTDLCYKRIRTPTLQITKEEANQMTWVHAKNVRKITSEAISMYYRRLRQVNVDVGREFFPTMFAYEFPFKTFRDCFFSYTPSKEEEVLACYVWAPYEVKNFSNRKSCLC